MTAMLADPPHAAAPAGAAPAARRLGRSRHVNARLVTGVLLLLASVAAGDRLLTSGRSTTPVLVATHDLGVGHVVTAGDLSTERVHLTGPAHAAYLAAGAPVAGRVLARAVGAGELVPAAAVGGGAAAPARLVAVAVADGHRPPLARDDIVDVYVTAAREGSCTTVPAVRGVEVADDVPATATSGTATVVLRVPVQETALLVLAAASGTIDVVVTRGAVATPSAPLSVVAGLPAGTGCDGRSGA